MDMIAMLSGLDRVPPAGKGGGKPSVGVPAKQRMEEALIEAIRKIKAMDDATLLGAATAALNNRPYGDSRAEQIMAVAPQLFAEVVARFGAAKLMELAPTPATAAAAAIQSQTAAAAESAGTAVDADVGGVSPAVMGLLGLVVGAGAVWWFMRRPQQ